MVETFRMVCGDNFWASSKLDLVFKSEVVLVLILGKIFVCSDFSV